MTCTLRLMMLFCELRANERRLMISNHRLQEMRLGECACAHTKALLISPNQIQPHQQLELSKESENVAHIAIYIALPQSMRFAVFFFISLHSSASHTWQTICGNSVTIIPLPRLIIFSNTTFKSGFITFIAIV